MFRNILDTGFLLQLKTLKEANKVATIFSQNSGKLSLQVKGGSKIKNKRSPSLDGSNLISFTYYKSKSNLDLLLEVKLIDDFSNLKKDMNGINALLYFIETINYFIQPDLPTKEYFIIFQDLLTFLDKNISYINLGIIFFQLQTLKLFGFEPNLYTCLNCQDKFKESIKRVNGNLGYLCYKHSDNNNDNIINNNLIKIQRFLINSSIDKINIKLSNKEEKDLILIQNNWIENVLERKILSLNLCKRLWI